MVVRWFCLALLRFSFVSIGRCRLLALPRFVWFIVGSVYFYLDVLGSLWFLFVFAHVLLHISFLQIGVLVITIPPPLR